MKKLNILFLTVSLCSCTAWRDNTKMDDYDLCSRLGYDMYHGKTALLKSDAEQIAYRVNTHHFTHTYETCSSLAKMQYQIEEEDNQHLNAGIAAFSVGASAYASGSSQTQQNPQYNDYSCTTNGRTTHCFSY